MAKKDLIVYDHYDGKNCIDNIIDKYNISNIRVLEDFINSEKKKGMDAVKELIDAFDLKISELFRIIKYFETGDNEFELLQYIAWKYGEASARRLVLDNTVFNTMKTNGAEGYAAALDFFTDESLFYYIYNNKVVMDSNYSCSRYSDNRMYQVFETLLNAHINDPVWFFMQCMKADPSGDSICSWDSDVSNTDRNVLMLILKNFPKVTRRDLMFFRLDMHEVYDWILDNFSYVNSGTFNRVKTLHLRPENLRNLKYFVLGVLSEYSDDLLQLHGNNGKQFHGDYKPIYLYSVPSYNVDFMSYDEGEISQNEYDININFLTVLAENYSSQFLIDWLDMSVKPNDYASKFSSVLNFLVSKSSNLTDENIELFRNFICIVLNKSWNLKNIQGTVNYFLLGLSNKYYNNDAIATRVNYFEFLNLLKKITDGIPQDQLIEYHILLPAEMLIYQSKEYLVNLTNWLLPIITVDENYPVKGSYSLTGDLIRELYRLAQISDVLEEESVEDGNKFQAVKLLLNLNSMK